ncbi:universal stress protein A-like protein [Chenopodium quinoa]|uniref:universal stress protein A-like protein n=1 Tax=Chenopodium quinoa TaxID=63459 RepID=UPI000B79164C|nr:universal stress protein A-like protein [Chenopodium quinoa]
MKVMIALDESKGSFYALNWVLSNVLKPVISTETNDNEERENLVYLVHVNLPFQTYVYPAGPVVYTTTSVLESGKHAQEQISAGIFARAMKSCKDMKIKAEALTMRGEPKEVLCQVAEQKQVDLLVVGSRGLGVLKRAFLGSVSDYCMHHAHCPVLIVKPPKELNNNEEVPQKTA